MRMCLDRRVDQLIKAKNNIQEVETTADPNANFSGYKNLLFLRDR
jgi:hypothetical protein